MSTAAAQARTRIDVERLTSLGERFRMWQKRQGGSYFKTPSYLWDDAFDLVLVLVLVPVFGARRVARELGLSRDELVRRMNEEQGPVVAAAPASTPARDTPQAAEDVSLDIEFLEVEMEWPGIAMPPTPAQPTAAEAQAPAPPLTPCEPERPAPAPAVTGNAAAAPDIIPLRTEEAWLEVVAADGAKLTMRVSVNHLMSVSALVRVFRSQR